MAPPAEIPRNGGRREKLRDHSGNIINNIWKTFEYRVSKPVWKRALREEPPRQPYTGRWFLQLHWEMNQPGPNTSDTINSILSWQTETSPCYVCGALRNATNQCGQACYDFWRSNAGPMGRLDKDCEIRPLPWNSGFPGHGVYLKERTPGGARMPSITRGQLIGEYLGELVPCDAPGGENEYEGEASGRYIFEGPHSNWLIDGGKWGNASRFINHHCRPNLKAVPVVVGGRRVVTFRALRAIRAGDELTVHYGEAYFNKYNERCLCNCKGRVVLHDPEPAP
ncbi:hypothetical protein PG985_007696 [Apiospora marii]|uniref:SET domain-containing protein n=1 Tax=Apiospora marii TaxID=335849 RepID=A0ABR1SQC4_9PEZI